MATSILWLVGCSTGPAPQVATPTTTVGDGTQIDQPKTRVVPSALEQPTSTPTVVSAKTASPRAPTPTTAPRAELLAPSPTPLALTTAPTVEPTTLPSPPPINEPYYEDRSGPSTLLASYYNAVNRREYTRAWEYWGSPPSPSYETFVQGFADTASVLLTVRPPTWFGAAAGSTYARVAALLAAIHVDGSRHNFVGCFVVRRSSVEGPGVDRRWSFYAATVRSTPGNSADAFLLTEVCEPAPEGSHDDRTGPVRLLASYYNAINQHEHARAWAYWETPPAPTFEEFARGFADTESVMLVVRPPTRLEGAAGSVYVAIPALVSATYRDDSRHAFVGCFVARRPNVRSAGVEREWSLFDATVECAPSNTTDIAVLDQVCATQ